MLDAVLKGISVADVDKVYLLLSVVGRKRRRSVLSKMRDVVNGTDRTLQLNKQPAEIREKVKEKFNLILKHYER
ncbi:MAG: hypothetical protein PUB21_08080 [Bacteroidales bacterium]|nr:hypothetical protein [Bacteroidales bacterium]